MGALNIPVVYAKLPQNRKWRTCVRVSGNIIDIILHIYGWQMALTGLITIEEPCKH